MARRTMISTTDMLRFSLVLPVFVLGAGASRGTAAEDEIREISSPKEAAPGEVALLKSQRGMRYFLKVPRSYNSARGARVIVFLHGSNMNGLSYLRSFEAKRWAPEDILVCPNGEKGGQIYGANNFTFSSAAHVAEVTREVLDVFKATRVYVGGHSQGGFLTYSVIMHHPELYHGALPMSGDCWMQNEPNLWQDKPAVMARQKEIAIAVIHGKQDPVVRFAQGQHAYDCFQVMGYPRLRLFAPERAGHQFMLLPVGEALDWLDAMLGDDAAHALKSAAQYVKDGEWGWAAQAAQAVLKMKRGPRGAQSTAKKILRLVEKAAAKETKSMAAAMAKDEPAMWLPRWWKYRHQFGSTRAASSLVKKFEAMRAAQRARGEALFQKARSLLRNGQKDEGHELLRKLLEEAPASYQAFYAVTWLQE